MSKSGDSTDDTHGGGSGGNDWCLIESDPGVFTELLESLGCQNIQVEELWSLDDASLERISNSGKVYGLIFLFKWSSEQHARHGEPAVSLSSPSPPATTPTHETADDPNAPALFFAHQVTTNACATQALLSVVLNAGLSPDELGSTLSEFLSFTATFPPHLKGVAISSSDEIKQAHNSFARPDAFLDVEGVRLPSNNHEAFHFVAYIPYKNVSDSTTTTVYELDGLQNVPLVAGTCDDTDQSLVTVPGLENWLVLARNAIQERMSKAESNHIKFNLLAVMQDPRINLKQRLQGLSGTDNETANVENNTSSINAMDSSEYSDLLAQLAAESAKRDQWKLENQRRRHNYVPLCVQLLRELAKMGTLPQLIQEAKERKRVTTTTD